MPDHTDDVADDRDDQRPLLVLRLSIVDLLCTLSLLTLLVVLTTMTDWPEKLYAFLPDVCMGDDCQPVPFGVNFYILPVTWGGIGAAVAAAVIGPLVSLVKGWKMYYWPILSAAILMVSSLVGNALTMFSMRFWH